MKIENLKRYWYFPISALAFLLLNVRLGFASFISIMISLIIIVMFTAQNENFFSNIHKTPYLLKIFSGLTAIGICMAQSNSVYKRSLISEKILYLSNLYSIDLSRIIYYCSPILAVIAFIFVYFCVIFFWNWFVNVIIENKLFNDLERIEVIIYSILLVIAFYLITVIFLKTDAFYLNKKIHDVIYTSDSPFYGNGNVFFIIMNSGFRHPLWGIFAAPFMGLIYLITKILGMSITGQAIIINYIQIFILFTGTYIIAKSMNLMSYKRILFLLVICCSYMYLLSGVMMEHYIIYFFWLSLLIYVLCNKNKTKFAFSTFTAAASTIITNVILIVFLPQNSLLQDFKLWLKNILDVMVKFIFFILAFGGFDILFNAYFYVNDALNRFAANVILIDKFRQYTFFIHNCFFAPLTRIILEDTNLWANPSWQLQFVDSVSYIGIIIFILCMISAFINWNKKSSRFAFLWVIFSFFVLGIVGWGTAENGLILYSLYFGWAFFVLMFQLVEKIEEKLNVKFLLPLYLAVNIYILFAINVPAMQKLIDFAIQYYPIAN